MIHSVHNHISLANGKETVFYPARLYLSREAALHAAIKDIYLSHYSVASVAVFEDPVLAYIETKPKYKIESRSLLRRFLSVFSRESDNMARKLLKLDVDYATGGKAGYNVKITALERPEYSLDNFSHLQTA